jgi:arabinofuranan 3-O-arabinosyltransferase
MPRPARIRSLRVRRPPLPAGLAVGCFLLAVLQRPGELIADTKVNLYVHPQTFLSDVASAWTPTGSLGHVFAGQYGGYLFPMGPWFALGDLLGVPLWLVHRAWLGLLLALAAWGVVRLMDALYRPERGVAHAGAAVLFVLNPYVAVYANRTSVALLAYAALPWLLLCVHRGLRDPRGWRWPAAFALVLTCTGGGVNVAVIAWVLCGPALFLLFERGWGGVPRGALAPFLVRLAACSVPTSAWWVVPVLVHARYGVDFLAFTEQPGTIWSTTSVTESLRLMGFWTSYISVGFGGELRPFASHAPALLFQPLVVGAGLIVPALALAGFGWTARWRYGPWFLLLTLAGLVIMAAGWPEGTPLRRGATFAYNHVAPVQFLRTTYKAGPLVALGLAGLGGPALAALCNGLGSWRSWPALQARAARALAVATAAALVALAAWPLTSGRGPEPQLRADVPPYWRAAAADLGRRGQSSRAIVLPGQLFASYRWGQTIDAILPALTPHPVATRYIIPYADLRASDLLWSVDALINQERVLPGQLAPLLDLMGVGDVVVNADGDRSRGGELGPAETARALNRSGLGRVVEGRVRYGPVRSIAASPERLAAPVALPAIRVLRVPTGGLVRVLPRSPLTVVDGSAPALTGLAAFGALRPDRPLAYAADLRPAALHAAARRGAAFVISDSNRRRAFVASRLRGGAGATLAPDQDLSADGTQFDAFRGTGHGPEAQTVAIVRGVRSLRHPFSPQVTQFPEHRPFAAFDGDERTAWLADRLLAKDRRYLDIDLGRPRDVEYLELVPHSDARGEVRAVEVNGRRFAVRRGVNRLRVRLRAVRRLRVRLVDVRRPRDASGGGGGIRELRIPGVHVSETLRPPVLVERALRGADLDANALTYLFERTTADVPALRGRQAGEVQAGLLRDARDPESQLARTFTPPAPRRYRGSALVSVDPSAPDDALDRMAGVRGALRTTSSSRFDNRPGLRASGAFDGSAARAWVGQWIPGRPAWIAWKGARATTVSRLRLVPPRARVRRPTLIRVRAGEADSGPVAVRTDGLVVLPRALRGHGFRLDVLRAAFPRGPRALARARQAVGIGELRGTGQPRLQVPGALSAGRARAPAITAPCGAARLIVAGRPVGLRAAGTLAAFDAGRPLRARLCDTVALPAAQVGLFGRPAALRVDHLRLSSAAPAGTMVASLGGRVLDPGRGGRGRRDGVRVQADGPSWLVLGESYNRGWRARCDGRELGPPRAMQGYANAWPIAPGCGDVSFAFAPNRALPIAYGVSAVACALLLAVCLAGRRRRRRRGLRRGRAGNDIGPAEEVAAGRPQVVAAPPRSAAPRWSGRGALAAGVLAAVVLGFVFALRAGVVLGPVVALALWRGAGVRGLSLTAGALLGVAVPVAYALPRDDGRAGYTTNYANLHIAGHWIGVLAVTLLGLALALSLRTARGPRDDPAPAPPGAGPRRSAP